MLEEDEDTLNENIDKKYEGDDEEDDDVASVVSKPSNLKSMAPISSISEVSLADRKSLVSFLQKVILRFTVYVMSSERFHY